MNHFLNPSNAIRLIKIKLVKHSGFLVIPGNCFVNHFLVPLQTILVVNSHFSFANIYFM